MMRRWDELIDDDWHLVSECPKKTGRYLVVQEDENHRKYRWIRYFNGDDWCNASMEKYGKITHWSHLKDWP